MKRNYFLFQGYFAVSLICGLILTLGNLKAQTLSAVEISVDSLAYGSDKNTSAGSAKIFISEGTEISNKELIVNTEFVNIPNPDKKTKSIVCKKIETKSFDEIGKISKKRSSDKVYVPVKSYESVNIPHKDSDVFFASKEAYKCLPTPQNNHLKGKLAITDNLEFKTVNISKDSVGYIFVVDIPNGIFSETPSIRPPPVQFI